jgi:S-adenosylmethionine-dependent methyltransferase
MKPIASSDYDQVVDKWKEWQSYPWGKLVYRVARINLQRHMGDRRLRILDVGGGNGYNAIYFAKLGHAVTLLDYSPAMLAEARKAAALEGVVEKISFIQADVNDIQQVLGGEQFDLILCHLMIEFVGEPVAALHAICQRLAPGGLLSVLDANRYSEVYRKAFQANDLVAALGLVESKAYFHPWFNCLTPLFSSSEMISILCASGCELIGDYGVLCLCAYLPNEPKYEAAYFQALENLECRLTDTYPYHLLARFYQVLVKRT